MIMADNTGGYANTALGFNALHSLGSTQWNTAVGMDAMYSQTSGGIMMMGIIIQQLDYGNTGLGADATSSVS